jgi:hypothetical protein
MLSLAEAQANFIETINSGPTALDPALFAGRTDRVMLGLKAHANTISHARLVALEECFPFTRVELGDADFNKLSRAYIETDPARAADNNGIGRHFLQFLREAGQAVYIVELAEIEWCWLESYHAEDLPPLSTADLAPLGETTLLAMPVNTHPSVRLVAVSAPLASSLDGLAGQMPSAIATLRPDLDVRLLPLDVLELALLRRAGEEFCTMGNLIELSFEQAGERAPLEPILHLVGAGALAKAG